MYPQASIGSLLDNSAPVGGTTIGKHHRIKVPFCSDWTFTVRATTFTGTMKVYGSCLENPSTANANEWFDLISVSAAGTTHVTGKPARWIFLEILTHSAGSVDGVDHVGV